MTPLQQYNFLVHDLNGAVLRAFDRLPTKDQALIEAAAADIVIAIHARRGSPHLGRLGALELLAALGRFQSPGHLTTKMIG